MSYSSQTFTQSLRLMDPINQERIKQQKRILWPDYEVLTLINSFQSSAQKQNQQLDLSTLFMYCAFEERFLVKKTSKRDYLNLSQCYDPDFTHVALYMCKKYNYGQEKSQLESENSRSLDSRRKSSVERIYRPKIIYPENQELYIILSRRSVAVDEVVKTSHKVSISVVPLSGQKHLWGGTLNYEEFEQTNQKNSKNQQNSLFKTGGDNFGFNISSKPSNISSSIRKTNGTIDKRQLRFSNYYSSKKQKQQDRIYSNNKNQPKQCSNTLKLTPQHIRQHQQFLYIEVDLNSICQLPPSSNDYNFFSIDIFARHMKPKYGGKYDEETSGQQSDDQCNGIENQAKRFRKFMKEEIFLIYSMPFMEFNSYLQSQLNFQENQDLREINFRGSCSIFSAMKKLELKTEKKGSKDNQKQKEDQKQDVQQNLIEMKKKQKSCFFNYGIKENSQNDSSKEFISQPFEKVDNENRNISKKEGFEVIELSDDRKSPKDQRFDSQMKLSIQGIKQKLMKSLCLKVMQNRQVSDVSSELTYFPVFNPNSSQPHRLSIPSNILTLLNKEILKQTVQVEIESHRLKETTDQEEVDIDAPRQKARQSMYIGRSTNNQTSENPKNIKYIKINVFLTDKVYKKETVELVGGLLEKLEKVTSLGREVIEKQNQWIKEFDNLVIMKSVEQMKNFMCLLEDLNQNNNERRYLEIGSLLKMFIWIEILTVMDQLAQSQLDLVSFVKSQIQNLMSHTSLTFEQLSQKQQIIISLIKHYHEKSTFDQPLKTFFVELFFYFFTEKLDNKGRFSPNFGFLFEKNNEFESGIKVVETIFSKFFMMNCNNILGTYSSHLEVLLERLEGSLEDQEEDNEKDVEIDKDPTETVTVLEKDHNLVQILIVKLLKACVTYTIENISQIPINIFLSQPLEEFQTDYEEHEQPNQEPQTFCCKRIIKFIRRYFIRGNNYYLQRQNSQSQHELDTNVGYMNLIADMLKLYIRLKNVELAVSERKREQKVTNVIQLVNKEYLNCLNACSEIKFIKCLREKNSVGVGCEEIAMFKKIKQQKDNGESYQNRLNRQYSSFSANFTINPPTKIPPPNSIFTVQSTLQKASQSTNRIQIRNTKQSFPLSKNKQSSDRFDFLLKLTQKDSLDVGIMITPNILDQGKNKDSYEIGFLNTQLGLRTRNQTKMRKMLFSCYEVFVEVELVLGKSHDKSKEDKKDMQRISLHGGKLLVFDNFNTSSISTNHITLSPLNQSPSLSHDTLSSIQKVSIRLFSRQLPILEHSLSFINLRVNKYLKALSFPINPNKSKSSSRKTIGGRFTEHLSKRNSVLEIEENMGMGSNKYGRSSHLGNKKTTLLELPEDLLYHLLNADKCYVQEEDKLLMLVDQYYQRNHPIYQDYILYSTIRPFFLRLSTTINHFFAHRTKYQDSQILQSFIKLKMSSPQSFSEQSHLAKIFTSMSRISSIKPLKNAKDTLNQRDLLIRYVKEPSKRQSLEKKRSDGLFSRKKITVKQQIKESRKEEEEKDVEI